LIRYRVNDNLHSQFSRTGRPVQRHIDADPSRSATSAYGRAAVLGLSSDTALNDFTMGGTATGVAWSINPYLGCVHACAFCYVPETMHLERNRWGTYVAPKHNLPALLRRELKRRPRRTVYLSTGTDAYQAPEREHQLTRRCLRLLLRHDWPIDILTRSPLVLRDADLLKRLTRVRVGLSIPTLDDEARRLMEPNAPPIRARLKALRRLSDAGIPTYANLAPAYPPTQGYAPTDVAREFKDAGVQWVNVSHWKRVPTYLGPMWDRLHKTEWEDFARFVADPSRQERLQEEYFEAFRAVGLLSHVGFYNAPFDLTPNYEATSQLRLETGCPVPTPSLPALEPELVTLRVPA
jgi:DNA repair photolyase